MFRKAEVIASGNIIAGCHGSQQNGSTSDYNERPIPCLLPCPLAWCLPMSCLRCMSLLSVVCASVLAGCEARRGPNVTAAVAVTVVAPPSQTTSAAAPAQEQPAAGQPAAAKITEPKRPLTDAELADGWISLFDGQTLFGWKAGSKANWSVTDAAIRVSDGEKGLLCTTVPFDNYVLKAEFRAAKATNSGIFLRTAAVPGMDDIKTKCYELNIAPPDNPFPTGSFVQRQKGKEVPERADEWQSYEVTLDGPKATVKLNGEEVLSYVDPAPFGRGLIGLQLNTGAVEFRNIKLRPLGLAPLFNGKDLAGWKGHRESKSKFVVTEKGELNVTSTGRGCIESEQQFGDFVLQLECISHAPSLNSGLFFRCIPGEFMNGYESQIHNGIKNGDRTQPVDCGTGGIFRRVNARLVNANDKEWFTKTIIAAGPHISVWVNGYQVTDWTDERKPDKNPRDGLRLERGTLQIQGHDPTTNLSFRNLRARELAQ
jgi:3-keto-disaccharide hydrolase